MFGADTDVGLGTEFTSLSTVIASDVAKNAPRTEGLADKCSAKPLRNNQRPFSAGLACEGPEINGLTCETTGMIDMTFSGDAGKDSVDTELAFGGPEQPSGGYALPSKSAEKVCGGSEQVSWISPSLQHTVVVAE